MAAIAQDVMTSTTLSVADRDGQTQTASTPLATSTPFPTSASVEPPQTLAVPQLVPWSSPSTRSRHGSDSTSRSRPRSILVYTDHVGVLSQSGNDEKYESPTEAESSSPSSFSESDSQISSGTDGSYQSMLTSSSASSASSSASSSGFEADSTASSTRTRTTTFSGPCVTFAPLPDIGPRTRKSSRPLGLAARGQILRQRRMMMAQDKFSYYDDAGFSIPGGERMGQHHDNGGTNYGRQSEMDETDAAIEAFGKVLEDVTKVIWRKLTGTKSKSNDSSCAVSKASQTRKLKRPPAKRNFTWPGRQRSSSAAGQDSDDAEGSDDEIDGPWSRRRDEDPMTKTIVEGSDDEQFVLAYDTMPACEEEEWERANAFADEEIRATVEDHLVKAAEEASEE